MTACTQCGHEPTDQELAKWTLTNPAPTDWQCHYCPHLPPGLQMHAAPTRREFVRLLHVLEQRLNR